MQFLANENFPDAAVKALRAMGHDVAWVRLDAPGSSDREVLTQAVREQRVLLTFDKDFGELARSTALPPQCGVVLFRVPMPAPQRAGEQLAAILNTRNDWPGHFSVVDRGRIRMRLLARP